MQNLEEIREEYLNHPVTKEIIKSFIAIGMKEKTIVNLQDAIADWWLKKWQERELALWQAMEEKKIPENPKAYSTTLTKKQIGHNNGISEAQSLLSVNSSKE